MTKEHEASRRLVKSPPELWAECSDPGSLARHLGEFGGITITRVEPETTVAWEGERASGTIRIEPSGWGTRVTLTALTELAVETTDAADEVPEPEPVEEESDATPEETLEEPDPALAADTGRARSRWRRLRARFSGLLTGPEPEMAAPAQEESGSVPEVARAAEERDSELVEAEPVRAEPVEAEPLDPPQPSDPPLEEATPDEPERDPEEILVAALDSLGQAHHRPFSRA